MLRTWQSIIKDERLFVTVVFVVMFFLMRAGYGNTSPMTHDNYNQYTGVVHENIHTH